MPTSILLDLIRTRRGLKWGIPAMLVAARCLLAASICTNLIVGGGPGGLNLFVLLLVWNAMKSLIMGPVSLVPLIRAHVQRAVASRHSRVVEGDSLARTEV